MQFKETMMKEFWLLLICTFLGIALCAIVIPIATLFFPGVDLASTLMLHVLQWSQTIFVMILPPFAWCKWRMKKSPLRDFGFLQIDWKVTILSCVFMICSIPAFDIVNFVNGNLPLPQSLRELSYQMSSENFLVLERMMSVDGIGGWIELVLLISVGTAIGEETMFRGALYKCLGLSKLNEHWIAIFVGLIFSIIHFEPLGFLTRWILGALLCYLVIWTGSIWPSVVMHTTNNLIATIQYKCFGMGGMEDTMELTFGWTVSVASLIASVLLFLLIRSLRTSSISSR